MSSDSPYMPSVLNWSDLRVRHRLGLRLDIVDQALGRAALVGDHDHVVGGAEVAFLDALLIDEVVGHFELIERVAHPADFLRAAPGAE